MKFDQSLRVRIRNFNCGGTRIVNRLTFACAMLFFAGEPAADNTSCPTAGNHERWTVKTSAGAQPPVTVTLKQIKNIEVPPKAAASNVKNKPGLLQGEFKTDGLSLKEGQMVRTTGWLHLVNYDQGDSDYHLQLTEDATGCTDGCVIVEIPRDICAAEPSEAIRWHFLGSRTLVDVDFAHLKWRPILSGENRIGHRKARRHFRKTVARPDRRTTLLRYSSLPECEQSGWWPGQRGVRCRDCLGDSSRHEHYHSQVGWHTPQVV